MSIDVEHWRAVITESRSRPKAKKALGCTFKALKDFRAQYMPDHNWPDLRQPEDIAREQFEARERKRARAHQPHELMKYERPTFPEPTPEDIEAALPLLTVALARVMREFVPGSRTRELENEYEALRGMGLVQAILRPKTMRLDGYGYTPLGRAVQAALKDEGGKAS